MIEALRVWGAGLLVLFSGLAAIGADEPAATGRVDRLSLRDCLVRMNAAHPLLEAARFKVSAAEARETAVERRRWPVLAATALTGPAPEARGDAVATTTPVGDSFRTDSQWGPFWRVELQVEQPLYTFGKIDSALEASAALARKESAERAATWWQLATRIKILYSEWLMCEETLRLLDDTQAKLARAEAALEKHLAEENTSVTAVDRFKINTYGAELDARRAETESRFGVVRDQLARLIRKPPESGPWRPLEDGLNALAMPAAPGDSLRAIPEHPLLKAAACGLQALKADVRRRRAESRPDLFLGARVRYAEAPNRDDPDSPFAYDDFNLFDAAVVLGLRGRWGFSQGAEVSAAEAELRAMSARREAAEQDLLQVAAAAGLAIREADAKMEAARNAYRASRAWSLSVLDGYEMGVVSTRELTEGLRAFAKARFEQVEAMHRHNAAWALYSAACGKEWQTELAGLAPAEE